MNLRLLLARLVLVLSLLCAGLLLSAPTATADPNPPVPAVLDAGFSFYAKAGAELALDTWRKGGLAEVDGVKIAAQLGYIRQAERAVGNYRSYDVIEARRIGASSRILYLSINYQRGAVYARFVVFRTEKDWVVQSMDFSLKPETIMPWLAFEAVN